MLRNYWTVARRTLARNKAYAFINVAGLALGIAACLLVVLYVADELRYDRFNARADRTYRIVQDGSALTPGSAAPALAADYPGVTAFARVLPTLGDVLIRQSQDRRFYESHFYWADASILEVFTFPLLRGDPSTALASLNTVVLSASAARRYFGEADPLGQTIVFDVGAETEMTVSGVMADPPLNSHFRPDFLASMQTFDAFGFVDFDEWDNRIWHSYVVLAPDQPVEEMQAALPALYERYAGAAPAGVRLQPITGIHLSPPLRGELEPSGRLDYVYALAAVALLILLVGGINFVNLSTARAVRRVKEVGVRKSLGATRIDLVRQFLGESVLLALAAVGGGVLLAYLALPAFNALAGKALTLQSAGMTLLALALLGLTGLVGVVAGSYPALVLSSPSAGRMLGGRLLGGAGRPAFRKALVVVQFAVGIGLIACTLVVREQLRYMQEKALGFDREQTLVVAARTYGHATTPIPFEAMIDRLERHPDVALAAATGDVPGADPRAAFFRLEGMEDQDAMAETNWNLFDVDYGFVEAMGLELVAGRSFSESMGGDERNAVILNETALRAASELMGTPWEQPLGRQADRYLRTATDWVFGKPGRVIGVVRDFHYQSLHHQVAPLVLHLGRARRDNIIVRLRPGDPAAALAHAEAVWKEFLPERPFEYYFLDAAFNDQYQAERRVSTLMSVFTGLSLVIAALGLFGLAAFTAERRTREIGIRKVLGASTAGLVFLLAGSFTRLVALAFVLVAPLAYLLMDRWLDGFAYRTEVAWWVFALTALAALALAWLTVGYQSVRAALSDPVDVLRYE